MRAKCPLHGESQGDGIIELLYNSNAVVLVEACPEAFPTAISCTETDFFSDKVAICCRCVRVADVAVMCSHREVQNGYNEVG